MTARQQPAVWRWPTASPPWSRGSRCRRTRSSCLSLLWPTWCAGSTRLRSSRPWGHAEDPPKVTYLHQHGLSVAFFWYAEQQGLLEISVFLFLFWSCLFRNLLISFLWLVVGLLSLSLSLLSSPLLDRVVLLNVLCVMCIRPRFDEKVSLSRQQCWEARYADCEVLSALTRPGVAFTKKHLSVTACWNSIVHTVVSHQETHSYCQYYTAWGQCTVVWVWR